METLHKFEFQVYFLLALLGLAAQSGSKIEFFGLARSLSLSLVILSFFPPLSWIIVYLFSYRVLHNLLCLNSSAITSLRRSPVFVCFRCVFFSVVLIFFAHQEFVIFNLKFVINFKFKVNVELKHLFFHVLCFKALHMKEF